MPSVVRFEIHADEVRRAIKFYRNVFGWEINESPSRPQYYQITTGTKEEPGIDGGIIKRIYPVHHDNIIAYVCTIDVPSIEEYLVKVTQNYGSISMPKMALPGVGWLAYCKDTEKNLFGLMQQDENAK